MKFTIFMLTAVLFIACEHNESQGNNKPDNTDTIYAGDISNSNYYSLDSSIIEPLNIDLNHDEIADLKFCPISYRYCGGENYHSRSYISPINGTGIIIDTGFVKYDSTAFNESWETFTVYRRNMAPKLLEFSQLIDQNSYWTDTGNYYLHFSYQPYVNCDSTASSLHFNGLYDNMDKYLGFRITTITDTLYGWLKIRVEHLYGEYSIVMEEYAYR